MERVFRVGNPHGHQIGERRVRPSAIRQRGAAAEKQNAAAAPIDELADQRLLLGVK